MPERVTIQFDLPPSAEIPADLAADKKAWRDAATVLLYKQGRLSMLQAREIMGLTRRQFEENLRSFGVAMMDADDFQHEVDAGKRLFPDA